MNEKDPGFRLRAVLAFGAVLLTQLPLVPSTNFGGYDEWLILELNSRGVVSVPYAYRPLALIWTLPALPLVGPLGFSAYTALYAVYALLTAVLVFELAGRLAPRYPLLAALSAVTVLVWAPSDMARLSTVERAAYEGIAFGTLLAMALLVEAWRRQSVSLLAVSLLAAFVAIRCYEGGGALLLGAPLLLWFGRDHARRPWRWTLAWEGIVVLALATFMFEMLLSPSKHTYQATVLRPDLDPLRWLARMAAQYGYHLLPLVRAEWRDLRTPAVPLAGATFILAFALLFRNREVAPPARRSLLAMAAFGLLLAGLGYSVVLVGAPQPTAFRQQFLSAPGAALFIASVAELVASFAPGRARLPAAALLGAWVVAVGTGRTLTLQRLCDQQTYHPAQMRMLSGLVDAVPDVVPHTLVVLIEEGRAWPAGLGFHHAVQYLYGRRASAYIPGLWDAPYPTTIGPEGIRVEPWPIVRRAWDAPKALYRYDEVVALRHSRAGDVTLLDAWPPELPALPAGALYAPRPRILAGSLPRRAILGVPRPVSR